jgi:membrane protein implicated in regulation of membrane protease activity
MWIIIILAVCFWSGVAALLAGAIGWNVLPVTLATGSVTLVILLFVFSLVQTASARFPDNQKSRAEKYYRERSNDSRPSEGFVSVQRQ